MTGITIFKAKKIITMNPRQPVAEYVAIRDGLILGAGALDDLTGWGDHVLDEQFSNKVIMPGFVEGHCHSWEGAAWEDTYVGFLDRTSPSRQIHSGLKTIDAVLERLIQSLSTLPDGQPVKGWGLDPIFFSAQSYLRRPGPG